eukprot:gene13647-16069_t
MVESTLGTSQVIANFTTIDLWNPPDSVVIVDIPIGIQNITNIVTSINLTPGFDYPVTFFLCQDCGVNAGGNIFLVSADPSSSSSGLGGHSRGGLLNLHTSGLLNLDLNL